MRTGTRIGVVLIGAALLAVGALLLLRDEQVDSRVTLAVPTRETPADPVGEPLGAGLPQPVAVIPVDIGEALPLETAARFAQLSGRVMIRGENAPAAGVRVSAETRGQGADDSSVLTDADGYYVFRFANSTQLRRVLVDASPATAATRTWFFERLIPPAERMLDLEVTRGAQVAGRVLDESGAPVVDAVVRSFDASPFDLDAESEPQRETRTDTFGRYALAAVGAPVTILAAAPGRACSIARSGEPVAGRSYTDVDLRLVLAHEIAGVVVDETGAAAANAELSFQPHMSVRDDDGFVACEPWPWPATSDDAGRFTFEVPPESTVIPEFELQVKHPQFATWSGRMPEGEPAKIVLARGAELTGFVMDDSGSPVVGAELRAVSRLGITSATSGADGSFRIGGLASTGKLALLAHGRGHAIQVDEDIELQQDGLTRHDVRLPAGRVLAGRVRDGSGRAVPGAHVEIEGDRLRKLEARVTPKPTWERWFALDEAVADDQGCFRIDDLYDGSFEVAAFLPSDKGTRAVVPTRTPDEHVELILPDAAATRIHLVGRITDSLRGSAIDHASFAFLARKDDGGWSGPVEEVSAPGGQYDLLGPMAGLYKLSVTAQLHSSFADGPRDFVAGIERLDIALGPLRSLVVQVVRADGSPVPRASVDFRGEDGARLSVNTAEGLSAGWTTDEAGGLRVNGLPARRVTLGVRLGADEAQDVVDLSAEQEHTSRIVLPVKAVRTIEVAVCMSRESIAADIDKLALRALLDAGRAHPYVGPATLSARDAHGTVVAQASASVAGEEIKVTTADAEGSSFATMPAVFTEFRLTVPPDALTLELQVPGHAPWHGDVPSGLDPVLQLAVLQDG
jgi:hypothetical protein